LHDDEIVGERRVDERWSVDAVVTVGIAFVVGAEISTNVLMTGMKCPSIADRGWFDR
jgi:hypothetical protein